ncbi:MAG TPA: alpha-(1-_3)-arabinofuranosyltransferase family protein [Candidatus Saccharimonadales bacterium]|nr:alpha-(1->3)-arabinofuranosyltransferase family protein [Candidatus Saccharimonadales bacterium]
MKKISSYLLIAFVFLFSFVPFLWLGKGQILLGYDMVYPLNTAGFLRDRIYSWTTTQGFDMDQTSIQGSLIIHFIDTIPQFFKASPTLSQQFVFSFWFFLLLLSPFILVKRLEKAGLIRSRYLAYFLPVLYAFNFYVLQAWWVAERTKFSIVVATPLMLAVILPMMKKRLTFGRILKSGIICSLILTIFNGGGWVGLPLFGGLIVIFVCFYIFYIFMFFASRQRRQIWPLTLFFLIFGIFYTLLNAYTLLPFFLSVIRDYGAIVTSAGGIGGLIDWTKYISANASILNLLRLEGIPDWYNDQIFHPYSGYYLNNPLLIFGSFLFPFFALIALRVKRKENKTTILFFLFLLLVSIVFTAGTHKPLGFLFELLMRVIPGFAAFRSAIFKFGYAYWLAASFLIAVGLSDSIEWIIGKKKSRLFVSSAQIIFPIVVICGIVAYHFPYLSGNIFHIEQTSITTRVTLPPYISDFANWWNKNGGDQRVLLLPKLNDNWLFEQYNWNYMSLFPVLGNLASKNTIENATILTSEEKNIVTMLYAAINQQNFKRTAALSQTLGIKYFLVRNDFYYNYPDQETDNPRQVLQALSQNPDIKKVQSFGKWDLYALSDTYPIVYAKSSAIAVFGANTSEQYTMDNNPLTLDNDLLSSQSKTISSIIISPLCINCTLDKENQQFTVLKPVILLDSKLYELIQLRDRLFGIKNASADENVIAIMGETLKLTGQLNELISRDVDEQYVSKARDMYLSDLNSVSGLLPKVLATSQNPYAAIFSVELYLDSEKSYINSILPSKLDKKIEFADLEKIIQGINQLSLEAKSLYGVDDSSIQKKYRIASAIAGDYTLKVNKNSLGTLVDTTASNVAITLDSAPSISGKDNGDYINFGTVHVPDKQIILTLLLPPAKNLLDSPTLQNLNGQTCMVSTLGNFDSSKVYSLRFRSKNNFDSSFFVAIDNGNVDTTSYRTLIPISMDQVIDNRIIISTQKISLQRNATNLQIAFCADGLTPDIFLQNISDLSLVELSSPVITLTRKTNNTFAKLPDISYREIDQTHYRVFVKNAQGPFYVVLNRRYATGWRASLGEHTIGNRFNNVWFEDISGDSTIDISYRPQRYFLTGLGISAVSLVALLFLLWKVRRYGK